MLYLISILPKDTRDLLVNLAFEEAQRVGERGTPVPATPAGAARPTPTRAPNTVEAGFA
jgi:hypothetical protein